MNVYEMAKFLQESMQFYTPYDYSSEDKRAKKHPGRTKHIRDVAYGQIFKSSEGQSNFIPIGLDSYAFDIGNDEAEEKYPYYHILEDAQVIKKRQRGTTTSKGSQANVPARQRDYGKVIARYSKDKNGKIKVNYSQEYRKNVRGSRTKVKETAYGLNANNGTAYVNRHYHWIEKALEQNVIDKFTLQFGLKRKRTQIDFENELVEMDISKLFE